MNDSKILSDEEVEALLKVSEEKGNDLSKFVTASEDSVGPEAGNLTSLTELIRAECEKSISSFLRKKIVVKQKLAKFGKLIDCVHSKEDKDYIYAVFHVSPNDRYGMCVLDLNLLSHSINLLFGGQLNPEEPPLQSPGKVGMIISEKVCTAALEGFSSACKEYGGIDCEIVKIITSPNLSSKMNVNDGVYAVELGVFVGEIETTLIILISEEFYHEFVPARLQQVKYSEEKFWHKTIENQVVDSTVDLVVSLPDVSMKVSDLVNLKDGDLIPINDPTLVYVCMNNSKLFSAYAGQSKSKRVARIISEL